LKAIRQIEKRKIREKSRRKRKIEENIEESRG